MSIITISKGSYSHGSIVAEKLTKKLGYECISRDVLIEISKEFNIPEIKLTHALSTSPSYFGRYPFVREKYIAYIRTAILERLSKDNVIYHGFAGHFFLKYVPHVLKVRIIADMDDRIRCMMEREHVSSQKEALKMVEQVDKARGKWGMTLYGIDIRDCRLYDLVISIERVTPEDAADIICNTVKLKLFQTTPESQKLMDTLALEAREKLEEISTRNIQNSPKN